jgi:hypothetical protein
VAAKGSGADRQSAKPRTELAVDLFEYQSIPQCGWVRLDGSGCGI